MFTRQSILFRPLEPDEECPYCKEKDEALDAVVECLCQLMWCSSTPTTLEQNKAKLKFALSTMLDQS